MATILNADVGGAIITGDASGELVLQGGGNTGITISAAGVPTLSLASATGLPAAGVVGTAAILGANTFTGAQTVPASGLKLTGSSSGVTTFTSANAGASNFTTTIPAVTATLALEELQQNSKSAAYTLVLADAGKHILHPAADTTARTWTIPANSSVAYVVGTAITFVNQNAGGVITIAITTDTMRLAGAGTTGSRTLAANGVATALKITSTDWIISGTGLT